MASISTSAIRRPKPTRTFLPTVMDAVGRPYRRALVEERRRRRPCGAASRASSAGSIGIRVSATVRAVRVLHEERGLRLPELRQLRARPHGVRLPADLPEADAQRPVRRHVARRLRGHRSGVHLGEGDGARRGVQHDRSVESVRSAARSQADGHRLLAQFLSGRDSRPGHPKDLWKPEPVPAAPCRSKKTRTSRRPGLPPPTRPSQRRAAKTGGTGAPAGTAVSQVERAGSQPTQDTGLRCASRAVRNSEF